MGRSIGWVVVVSMCMLFLFGPDMALFVGIIMLALTLVFYRDRESNDR
jgi:hypothetical protein